MRIADREIEIPALDGAAMGRARARQDTLTKPKGSLGRLEDISVRVCGIRGEIPSSLGDGAVVLCAADHGVTAEGVSAYPSEVTMQMLANFASGGAAINVLARHAGARVVVVDVGTAGGPAPPGVLDRKVRPGTANIARGPAMSASEAERSVDAGIAVALEQVRLGAGIIATGEMGIGNTTASSAVLCALAGVSPAEAVGRGAGVDDLGLERKRAAVERALAVNRPDPGEPMGVLASVGGLEIGALAGVMLGAASERVPVVIDGFISGVAALLAARIDPRAVDYLFASHLSEEPGHRIALEELGLEPFLDLSMRLGEGTGAVLGLFVIEAAVRLLSEMATFESAGVSGKSGE